MPRHVRKNKTLYSLGLGGLALTALVVASVHPRHDNPGVVSVKPLAPVTFRDMERPDPVSLLTPARLPDRRFQRP